MDFNSDNIISNKHTGFNRVIGACRKIMSIAILLILLFSNLFVVNAEPFYFLPNLMSQIRSEIKKRDNIRQKLDFLDETYLKLSTIENANKKMILSDIKDFKRNFIFSYIREYTADKYLTGTGVQDTVKQTRRYYQAIKLRDITADIHPNYLAKLENIIREKSALDEESPTYKTYIYVLYSYLKNRDTITETTESALSSMGNFGKSREFIENRDYYESKFEKFHALEKPNVLSKNDFTRIYTRISSQKISPGSDYMKGFLYWYATYKKALGSNSLILNTDFSHSKQAYALSCEANSAKDLINYYNSKHSVPLVSEDVILGALPAFTGALSKDGTGSNIWEDPSLMFVGSVYGKQSSNLNNFTGYGVYAAPIVNAINPHLATKKLQATRVSVNEKAIMESVINENPVMFWYLTPVIKGKQTAYETRPTVWTTPAGKTVNGYLGEHTGILVGVDLSKDGKIENVYYYEGKSLEMLKMPMELFLQTTSFFNEMIVINKLNGSKKLTLK